MRKFIVKEHPLNDPHTSQYIGKEVTERCVIDEDMIFCISEDGQELEYAYEELDEIL